MLIHFTSNLKQHPEEAIHFLEYGVLAVLIFRAVAHRIRDWTVYVITILLVALVGTLDEFIQWLIPGRYWAFKDIGLNIFAGAMCVLAIWKAIRPKIICENLQRFSMKILLGIFTLDLIILGLCLSNTPDKVYSYTDHVKSLSWLRNEEMMAEFGYKLTDPEIGTFYSRFTIEDIRAIDYNSGANYGRIIPNDIDTQEERDDLIEKYKQPVNAFLYEFLLHLFRRDTNYDNISEEISAHELKRMRNTALKENMLLEKYFATTLKSSGREWPADKKNNLAEANVLQEGDYISGVGRLIVRFRLKTAWIVILISLITVWSAGLAFLHSNKKHQ